ncbi:hypothetical protein HG531_012872 [Fusarium graminearum]|nr:hypothetical protein HG531_012872 [Fusarium graminearum]
MKSSSSSTPSTPADLSLGPMQRARPAISSSAMRRVAASMTSSIMAPPAVPERKATSTGSLSMLDFETYTGDVDIELLRVGLGKTAILENRLLELHRNIREDDARVGNHNVDSAMGADMNSCLEQTDLRLPIGDIAVLEGKGRVWILSCEGSYKLLASCIGNIANDDIRTVGSPLTNHVGSQSIGTSGNNNCLALES